ncbi:MAG: DUF4111 domain-containing protein [Caldilineaceae bacterium]
MTATVHTPQPTPYQDVNTFLDLMHTSLRTILGDQLVALYLGGSLALGDFNPQRSDIDFAVVTHDELPPDTVAALAQMHARLWVTGDKWARKLDGSYVPQQVIRCWTPDHRPCPFVEAAGFNVTQQGSAIIQRHILREHGVVVMGPQPRTLLDLVTAAELSGTVRDMLARWWKPLLADPTWLQQETNQPFAVLTMCRMLYTYEHGAVASKPAAAHWCRQTLAAGWMPLIDWALAPPHAPEADHLAAALSLIAYTVDRCK